MLRRIKKEEYRAILDVLPENPTWWPLPCYVLLTGRGEIYAGDCREPLNIIAVSTPVRKTGDRDIFVAGQWADDELKSFFEQLGYTVYIGCDPAIGKQLTRLFPNATELHQVIYCRRGSPPPPCGQPSSCVRHLSRDDAKEVAERIVEWLWCRFPDVTTMLEESLAYGAFCDGRLVSCACVADYGRAYQNIAVFTVPEHRGRGFAKECARAINNEILRRGLQPWWSTTRENVASQRLAEGLGLQRVYEGFRFTLENGSERG